MGTRDEQRKQADRDFELVRQAVAKMPDAMLCEALHEIPHRKRLAIDKETTIGVGILSHRAADRIAELEKALRDIRAFLVEVNKGIEMGNIDSQIVADIDRALMERWPVNSDLVL